MDPFQILKSIVGLAQPNNILVKSTGKLVSKKSKNSHHKPRYNIPLPHENYRDRYYGWVYKLRSKSDGYIRWIDPHNPNKKDGSSLWYMGWCVAEFKKLEVGTWVEFEVRKNRKLKDENFDDRIAYDVRIMDPQKYEELKQFILSLEQNWADAHYHTLAPSYCVLQTVNHKIGQYGWISDLEDRLYISNAKLRVPDNCTVLKIIGSNNVLEISEIAERCLNACVNNNGGTILFGVSANDDVIGVDLSGDQCNQLEEFLSECGERWLPVTPQLWYTEFINVYDAATVGMPVKKVIKLVVPNYMYGICTMRSNYGQCEQWGVVSDNGICKIAEVKLGAQPHWFDPHPGLKVNINKCWDVVVA